MGNLTMPARSARPCTYAGCKLLVRDGTSRCPKHTEIWKAKPEHLAKRMTGSKLQRERARMMMDNPLCRQCDKRGLVALGTIRDHIVPIAEGGSDEADNTQLLCDACHDVKSEAERKRGIERWQR